MGGMDNCADGCVCIDNKDYTYASAISVGDVDTLPVYVDLANRKSMLGYIICGIPGEGHGSIVVRIANESGQWGGRHTMYAGEVMDLNQHAVYALEISVPNYAYSTDSYYRVAVL